jgi:hypothetical protein
MSSPWSITKYDENKVIRLNVGGTQYQVSRSLIKKYPDTMLARLISKEWRSDENREVSLDRDLARALSKHWRSAENREVFIDRDGTRFQYVLDYMRDQKVHLAMNASKESILMELEYFGFANVKNDSIDDRKLNTKLAVENILQVRNKFSERIVTIEKSSQEIKLDWVATKAASMVFEAQVGSSSCSHSNVVVIHQPDLNPIQITLNQMIDNSDPIKCALNVILSDYGLSVSTIQFNHANNSANANIGICFEMDPAN